MKIRPVLTQPPPQPLFSSPLESRARCLAKERPLEKHATTLQETQQQASTLRPATIVRLLAREIRTCYSQSFESSRKAHFQGYLARRQRIIFPNPQRLYKKKSHGPRRGPQPHCKGAIANVQKISLQGRRMPKGHPDNMLQRVTYNL